MDGFISIRKSIRWLPGVASEPTSTIVLTSPQRHFVDLRILKDENGSIEGIASQLDQNRLVKNMGISRANYQQYFQVKIFISLG